MIYSHAIPVALVGAFTCSACPAADVRSSSRTTNLNAHDEGVRGWALSHQRLRSRQMRVFGLPWNSLGDKKCRCHPYRRIGGVLSRAVRGGSSTPFDVTDDPPPSGYSSVGKSYHLIWSPSFGRNFFLGIIILFALTHMLTVPTIRSGLGGFLLPSNVGDCHSNPDTTGGGVSSTLSRSIRQLLLPLLSSSCCAVQLLINAFGIGCAGFNSVLGPLRPFFLSLLVYSTAISYPSGGVGRVNWCRNAALSFFFALMPELLHMWNNSQSRRRQKGRATQVTTDATVYVTVELDIPSMGCAACINKIDSTISGMSGVISSTSWLLDDPKGGRARIVIAANSTCTDDVDEIIKSVVEKVGSSGFPCTVDTVSHVVGKAVDKGDVE